VPASLNKLAMGGVGHSPGKQSVLLGRSTVVGVDGGPGLGRGKGGGANGTGSGSGSVPRQNSLCDLKIPVRISQEQVGLRRDLGMVREFAMTPARPAAIPRDFSVYDAQYGVLC